MADAAKRTCFSAAHCGYLGRTCRPCVVPAPWSRRARLSREAVEYAKGGAPHTESRWESVQA
eukprot:9873-Eustigmatos_ZCMA.PRE.1